MGALRSSLLLLPLLIGMAGCAATSDGGTKATAVPTRAMEAVRARGPHVIDGRLDEPAWANAPSYALTRAANQAPDIPREGGMVRLVWDDQWLYVGFSVHDADVLAHHGDAGQQDFLRGDVVEVFLKPAGSTWYWEFHLTPAGERTTYFLPGGGWLGLERTMLDEAGFEGAAVVHGTLNRWQDRDEGWTAEIAIPATLLTQYGDAFPSTGWTVFVGRYNYGRFLRSPELSMYPPLPRLHFHSTRLYAPLRLLGAEEAL